MVAALGGPEDFASGWRNHLAPAPVVRTVPAPMNGYIASTDARSIGISVIGLGGGRTRPSDEIDHRVGFSDILPVGARVEKGQAIARVHALGDPRADSAIEEYQRAVRIGPDKPEERPVILKVIS